MKSIRRREEGRKKGQMKGGERVKGQEKERGKEEVIEERKREGRWIDKGKGEERRFRRREKERVGDQEKGRRK